MLWAFVGAVKQDLTLRPLPGQGFETKGCSSSTPEECGWEESPKTAGRMLEDILFVLPKDYNNIVVSGLAGKLIHLWRFCRVGI